MTILRTLNLTPHERPRPPPRSSYLHPTIIYPPTPPPHVPPAPSLSPSLSLASFTPVPSTTCTAPHGGGAPAPPTEEVATGAGRHWCCRAASSLRRLGSVCRGPTTSKPCAFSSCSMSLLRRNTAYVKRVASTWSVKSGNSTRRHIIAGLAPPPWGSGVRGWGWGLRFSRVWSSESKAQGSGLKV